MSLEKIVIEYIEGKRKDPFILGFLRVCSAIFFFGCVLRHICYDWKIFSCFRVRGFVVSIGNIVAGGTGKSPFVQMLTKTLMQQVSSIAILSRGYRSSAERKNKSERVDVRQHDALYYGDEPWWLACTTGAAVWTGRDRVQTAQQAIQAGAKLLILDDGMQHRRLHRDVEIVLLHAQDPWGRGRFLPSGYLRDLPDRLKKADLIAIMHWNMAHDPRLLLKEIRGVSSAPVVGFSAKYTCQKSLLGVKVGAFCGVAKPEVFYQAIRQMGGDLVHVLSSPDHCIPDMVSLQRFIETCKQRGALYIVCTEKDEVKVQNKCSLALPICVIKMQLFCEWNEQQWHTLCQSIVSRMVS